MVPTNIIIVIRHWLKCQLLKTSASFSGFAAHLLPQGWVRQAKLSRNILVNTVILAFLSLNVELDHLKLFQAESGASSEHSSSYSSFTIRYSHDCMKYCMLSPITYKGKGNASPHLWTLSTVSISRGGGIYKRALYVLICLCLERAQLAQRAQGGGADSPLESAPSLSSTGPAKI